MRLVAPETPWSRQRDAGNRVAEDLLRLLRREFAHVVPDAWEDFNQSDNPIPLNELQEEMSIFSPYLFFEWDPDKSLRQSGKPKAGLIARSYMEKASKRLSDLESMVLEQAISRPVSFQQVVRVDPGRTVLMRDLLTGEEILVEEHTASEEMRPGDIAYAQIWVFPDVATLGRTAPVRIPPERKIDIVKLRIALQKKIAKQDRELNSADLVRYAEAIRTVYLDIRDGLRRPPQLANTDGDPFLSHTLTYQVASAQEAFDALAPLAWSQSTDELLEEAERDSNGLLQSVEFPWLKKGNKLNKTRENTVLGHLKISGQTLVVEVNSAARAKKIREEIEKRLGSEATHLSTRTEDQEQLLKRMRQDRVQRGPQPETRKDGPNLDPETLRQIEAEMQKQVEGWVRQKVPALGGRTPLEAVKDAEGKEMVEALLRGWERRIEEPGSSGVFRPDLNALRRLLNLPKGT